MSALTVYAVFATAEEAERIARQMIDERLAACVNILAPCRSIYRWHSAVESAEEVPAIFKTSAGGAEALVARIAEMHSYATPAVTAWPIAHLPAPYAKWIEESIG